MKAFKTDIEGVLLFKPDVFIDHRGRYVELYDESKYKEFLSKYFEDKLDNSKWL